MTTEGTPTASFPRSARAFMGTLPHRPPFVWIDEIVEVAADHGVCAVELKSDGLYFGPEGLRASSFLEFMAQGFGYLRAAQSVTGLFPDRPPPTKAFLVSIQDAVYATDPAVLRPASGTRLRIEISGVREVGPITLFAAVVRDASGTELVRARLKVFSE